MLLGGYHCAFSLVPSAEELETIRDLHLEEALQIILLGDCAE
jgi:hypothetical protein